jgi:hypothetical protein
VGLLILRIHRLVDVDHLELLFCPILKPP